MALLKFTVRNQRLSVGSAKLVSDSIDYIDADFDFRTEDWNRLSKWAHFTKGEKVYDVNLVADKITSDVHLNLEEGEWEVKLHGTDSEGTMRITTNTVYVYVESYGSSEEGEILPEIPVSAAEQIDAKAQEALLLAEEALEKSGGGNGIRERVEILEKNSGKVFDENGKAYIRMWFGSREEYDALETVEDDVCYHIYEG